MQPSTWNDSNQHWVPQFLLKGFGIKGKASKIWELDKQSGLTQIRKVKCVASSQELLTERDDDLMKSIENQATRPIRQIRKRNFRITEEDRQAIDRLVAALLQNDPYNGFDKEKTRREIIESTSRTVETAFKYSAGIVEFETIKRVVDENFNYDYLTNTMSQGNYTVRTLLRIMGLRAIFAEEGKYFVIGDSPVLAIRNRGSTGPSLVNPGSQVILPISSQCVLVYDWQTETNLVAYGGNANIQQLHSLNRDYSRKSNCRYVYGRNEECLIKSLRPQLRWENAQRSTQVGEAWSRAQQYLAAVRAINADEDKQAAEHLRLAAREVVTEAARQNEMHN